MKQSPSLAVYGCMSTNEIVYVNTIIGANEVCYTDDSSYVAGGKGTNMARMLKTLLPDHTVYFISKTAKDPHHLWEYPYAALNESGVDIRYYDCPRFTLSP